MLSLKPRFFVQAFGLAALGLAAGTANAQSIGVAFGSVVLATDSPGVVAGTNFNDLAGGAGTGITLNNNSGSATTAQITFNSKGAYGGFDATSTSNAGTNRMYTNGIYGDNTVREVTITVTGVPFANYKVYVYSGADGAVTNTLSITDSHTTYYSSSGGSPNNLATILTQTTSTNSAAPTAAPGQYQVFNETTSSFTLTTGGSINGVISNNVFGLQIVPAAAPEPGTLALALSLGVPTAFGILRRRRIVR